MRKIKLFSRREFVGYRIKIIRRTKMTVTFIALMSIFQYFYIYIHTSALPMNIGLSIAWWIALFVSTILCLKTPEKPTKMDGMAWFLNVNFLLFGGILMTIDPQEINAPLITFQVLLIIILGFSCIPIETNRNEENNDI